MKDPKTETALKELEELFEKEWSKFQDQLRKNPMPITMRNLKEENRAFYFLGTAAGAKTINKMMEID